jgi:energy-coupling factor transporter ATP-binding protein EcfA2
MRLKSLILENFGPFSQYQLDFPIDENAFILLSGKNNAGKSSIIRALKLLSSALKYARHSSQPIYSYIPKKDLEDIEIGRLIHNYKNNGIAVITGVLDTNRSITININNEENNVSFELPAYAPRELADLIGFIPPLGQIAERESFVTRDHVMRNLNTTLAPRHLRNHVHHLLNASEQHLIIKITNESWEGIELQELKLDESTGVFYWLYKEGPFFNEISWAGQGLQIWLQVITHMVRLSNKSTLLLDEPELFLHPEKQHDLIKILREYYNGSVIIATHSSELMNNVDISHIVHVQKNVQKNKPIQIADRNELEKIRSSIGSGFNLIASQFEDVDLLIATEYQLDYDVVRHLSFLYGLNIKTQNVRISGFNNWKHAINFKQAYFMIFGRQVKCSLLLDRDYYPINYLNDIKEEAIKQKVNLVYTPGKEIENLFLDEKMLESLVPEGGKNKLHSFMDNLYDSEYDDCFSKYLKFHNRYSNQKDVSISYRDMKPSFDVCWKDKNMRHMLIHGKNTIAKIRVFFKSQYNITLTTHILTEQLMRTRNNDAQVLISSLFEYPLK